MPQFTKPVHPARAFCILADAGCLMAETGCPFMQTVKIYPPPKSQLLVSGSEFIWR